MTVLWLAVTGDLVSLVRFHWLKRLCANRKPSVWTVRVRVCERYSPCCSELRLSTLPWFTTSSCCLDWRERASVRDRASSPDRPAPTPRSYPRSFVKWKQSAGLPKYFYRRLLSKQRVSQETKGESDRWPTRFDATAKLSCCPRSLGSLGESHPAHISPQNQIGSAEKNIFYIIEIKLVYK